MMGLTHLIVLGTLVAAGVQGNVQPPQPPVSNNGIVPHGKEPYAKLFQALPHDKARPDLNGTDRPRLATDAQPRVVCGMVVVPVKPSADPQMVVHPKQDLKTDYAIRKIAPQLCNE